MDMPISARVACCSLVLVIATPAVAYSAPPLGDDPRPRSRPFEADPVGHSAPATFETEPVSHDGDAADDPAIWTHPSDPAKSLVIANDKGGEAKEGYLLVYDLRGNLVQALAADSFVGNVDVRENLAVTSQNGVHVYRIDPTDGVNPLQPALESDGNAVSNGEGLCLWDRGAPGVADGLDVFTIVRKDGRTRLFPLTDDDGVGLLAVDPPVRDFVVGSEAEGCVVDDANGWLYLSEEDVGIWRYDLASPTDDPARTLLASVGPNLPADVEGLALAGGRLIASAQHVESARQNWVNVYDLAADGSAALAHSVRIRGGTEADDCDRTDGIAAVVTPLGDDFPAGLFVCQDGHNTAPGSIGNQNFKYVPLQLVLYP
jgi:myo-inositol-hexaphosphate 3-phosphohydrolase